MNPLVSIVMPVFNGGYYFSLALESALNQTYPNTEIIVVDDGSTDDGGTERRAQSFGDRIRYIRQPNGGVGSALNTGVEAMKGDIFCWLSHDDLFRSHKTAMQVEFYKRIWNKDSILFSDYTVIDAKGNDICQIKANRDLLLKAPMMALLNGSVNGCTVFIPRHLFETSRPFPEQYKFVQDYRLWNKLLRRYEFLHLPRDLVWYRSYPGQGSNKPGAITEGEELWIDMMDDASESERVQMQGSTQRFFEFMESHLSRSPYRLARIHAETRARAAVSESMVSIVVPIDTGRPAAWKTIDSALAQAHQKLEVLAAGPPSALSQMRVSGLDPRLRLIPAKSGETSDGLNTGLATARGDYVCFCRPGIGIGPDWLLRRLEIAQRCGIRVGYDGGPGARDLTARDLILGKSIALESILIHRSVIAEGFSFDQSALEMGDPVALLAIARSHMIRSFS